MPVYITSALLTSNATNLCYVMRFISRYFMTKTSHTVAAKQHYSIKIQWGAVKENFLPNLIISDVH